MAERTLIMDGALIYETIKKHVDLERRGNEYVGKCPWCGAESLRVSPDKGFFYCEGCKQAGNAPKFLSLIKGISYAEAIRLLLEDPFYGR